MPMYGVRPSYAGGIWDSVRERHPAPAAIIGSVDGIVHCKEVVDVSFVKQVFGR